MPGFPPPAVWEETTGEGWAGGAGPTALPSPAFSLQSISGKTSPGVHAAAGLSRTLHSWGSERQLIKYLQRVGSPFCLVTLPPFSLAHACAHVHTHCSPHKSASFCPALYSNPCLPHSIKQTHVLFVLKRQPEKCMYK